MTKNKFISIIEFTFFTGLFIFSMLGLFDIINVDILFIFFFTSIASFKLGLDNCSKRKFLSKFNIIVSILLFFACSYKLILKYLLGG